MSQGNAFGASGIAKSDVLVVIAHPDDEIFASGTLCLLAEKGLRIALICVTGGEKGSTLLFDLAKSEVPLDVIRRRELALSAWALGVREVAFLGQEDIHPDEWRKGKTWDRESLVGALRKAIQESDPKLIITHGPRGGYGHPAHREVSRCVVAAAREGSFGGSLFSFAGQVKHAFFSWHFDQPSNVRIDARGFLHQRVASLCYHQTQIGYFLQPDVPHTVRKFLSAMCGVVFSFTEMGRKRVPIVTPKRFFERFPAEGLVLQMAPRGGTPHFFQEHFDNDARVRLLV